MLWYVVQYAIVRNCTLYTTCTVRCNGKRLYMTHLSVGREFVSSGAYVDCREEYDKVEQEKDKTSTKSENRKECRL